MNTRYFKSDLEWENWLQQNHAKETELWLVYYKKHTGKPGIAYEDSVKTALCYGWIDSLIKKLDDDSYARKFSPRKENSLWSESNKKRIAELMKTGRMQAPGLKLVEAAKQKGNWDKVIVPPKIDLTVPEDFKAVLKKYPHAAQFFEELPKSHKKQYLIWIKMAKRTETRERRIKKSIEMLLEKKKLGLK